MERKWETRAAMVICGVAAVVVFHGVFLALYGRSGEMKYYIGLLKNK